MRTGVMRTEFHLASDELGGQQGNLWVDLDDDEPEPADPIIWYTIGHHHLLDILAAARAGAPDDDILLALDAAALDDDDHEDSE